MSIKDLDLNKDGVTLGDHMEKAKEKATNLFDGDDSNSNNVIDRISHQMLGSNVADKISDVLNSGKKADNKEDKKK